MKGLFVCSLLLVLTFAHYANATYGVDVSQSVSKANFQCLIGKGHRFAIVRAGRSTGTPDPAAPATIHAAWSAGMKNVDVYIFPCPKCGNAAGQARSMIEMLRSHNATYGMVWLDIEGPQYWHSSQTENRAFYEQLVGAVRNTFGKRVGIYTSASQWGPIMGDSYHGGAAFPLWYAHYDGTANFNDFRAFAGWSKPSIKQYAGDITECGVGLDKNWYP